MNFWQAINVKVDKKIKKGAKPKDIVILVWLINKSTFIGLRDVTAILTMYKTGIRINTLGQLNERHIDWENIYNELKYLENLLRNNYGIEFEREISELLKSPSMEVLMNEVVLPESFISIRDKILVSYKTVQLTMPNESEYDFIYGIKLPEYKTFDKVDEFTKKFNYIFATILRVNNSVKLVGFDTGSEWFRIALEGFADYKIITLFIAEALKLVRISLE